MSARYTVANTAADRRKTAEHARVRAMASKGGQGVVARRDIPAHTLIAPYPGARYTLAEYQKRLTAGLTTGKYAIAFYKPDKTSTARTNYIIDPEGPDGRLLPELAGSAGPLVNEPGPGTGPNLIWVWNLPKYRLELWTARPVAKGEELTACYGNSGDYPRDYSTSCAAPGGRRAAREPELHVVTTPRARPVPYSLLGPQGVRRALRGAT